MSSTAKFSIHGELASLLPPKLRAGAFDYTCARAATLKNAIESLGIPHTEVGSVTVNGAPATLGRAVREGDAIEIHPWVTGTAASPEGERRFLADAHLGGLARFLRLLGFDTSHENALADADIRSLALDERRIVLTRDRELLKRSDVPYGCLVRTLRAEEQLREVAVRYALAPTARPFTLCLRCNFPLDVIDRSAIEHRLPEKVRALHRNFRHCRSCDRIYWPGTHYEHMRTVLKDLLPELPEPGPLR